MSRAWQGNFHLLPASWEITIKILFQLDCNNRYENLFAHEVKIMKTMISHDSCRELLEDINKLHQQSQLKRLKLNLHATTIWLIE